MYIHRIAAGLVLALGLLPALSSFAQVAPPAEPPTSAAAPSPPVQSPNEAERGARTAPPTRSLSTTPQDPPRLPAPDSEHAEPSPSASGSFAELELFTTQDGVSFHMRKSGTVPWTRMCLGGCEIKLTPGEYEVALSLGVDEPVAAPKPVHLPVGSTQLDGVFHGRSGGRIAGWITIGASLLLGAGIAAGALNANSTDKEAILGVGAGVGLVGILLGGLIVGSNADQAGVYPRATYAR